MAERRHCWRVGLATEKPIGGTRCDECGFEWDLHRLIDGNECGDLALCGHQCVRAPGHSERCACAAPNCGGRRG